MRGRSGKKQVWFERENEQFKFGDNLKGENKLIEEVTRPNALFLSAAVQHKHPQLHADLLVVSIVLRYQLAEPDPAFVSNGARVRTELG